MLAATSAFAVAASPAAAAVGDVPPGRTLVVIGQSGVERADALGAATGTEPAGAMWYLPLYEQGAVKDQLDDIEGAVASHPGLVVNLGVSFGAVSTPSPPYTAAIAAGAFDGAIDELAQRLKRLETIAYLRLGYEFDLLGGQYGPPEVYKAAYRRIVDRLRAQGVNNVSYVWHSAGAFWRATDPSFFAVGSGSIAAGIRQWVPPALQDPQPITAFYPGRDYVDAFGISYWQDSCCFGRSAQQARDVYEARTREILAQAQALGLPLQISEATPVYIGADSGAESVAWLDRTFALIEEFDIRMLSLISIDWREGGFFAAPFWNGYWPDARIHRHAATCARYVEHVSRPRYVHRTPDLPERLGLGGSSAPLPSPQQRPPRGCGARSDGAGSTPLESVAAAPRAQIKRTRKARLRGERLRTGVVVRCPHSLPDGCRVSARSRLGSTRARIPSGGRRELVIRVRHRPDAVRFRLTVRVAIEGQRRFARRLTIRLP